MPPNSVPAISLHHVSKQFGKRQAIDDVSFDVEAGACVALVGPSGCGKTTLLRIIAGLELPDIGAVRMGGRLVNGLPPWQRDLAMVFQDDALYPHLSVAQNLRFGMCVRGASSSSTDTRLLDMAQRLRIEPYLDREPASLSGGERQRAAIARALLRDVGVLLLDEPLSSIDASGRHYLRTELALWQRQRGVTTIYVTHDQREAMSLADHVIVMREGGVEQVGTPLELYHRPANLFVAQSFAAPPMNVLEVSITGVAGDHLSVCWNDRVLLQVTAPQNKLTSGDRVTIGVRAEAVTLDERGPLEGEVVLIEQFGSEAQLHVQLARETIWVVRVIASDLDIRARVGQRLRIQFDSARVQLFDAAGRSITQAYCV